MNINNVNLEKVGVDFSQYPDTGLPEVALLGRSNVGKSSLINNFLNRKKLARTSANPGKTRTINFYNVDDKMYLVDLPGYGYAKTSKDNRAAFKKMMDDYIFQRETLAMAILLIDSRHKPTSLDVEMFNTLMKAGMVPLIVATKTDKLNRAEKAKVNKRIMKAIDTDLSLRIIHYSVSTNAGRDELISEISEYIAAISED